MAASVRAKAKEKFKEMAPIIFGSPFLDFPPSVEEFSDTKVVLLGHVYVDRVTKDVAKEVMRLVRKELKDMIVEDKQNEIILLNRADDGMEVYTEVNYYDTENEREAEIDIFRRVVIKRVKW